MAPINLKSDTDVTRPVLPAINLPSEAGSHNLPAEWRGGPSHMPSPSRASETRRQPVLGRNA
eukprot:5324792-Heterocapsa_arctica.AAC.1